MKYVRMLQPYWVEFSCGYLIGTGLVLLLLTLAGCAPPERKMDWAAVAAAYEQQRVTKP